MSCRLGVIFFCGTYEAVLWSATTHDREGVDAHFAISFDAIVEWHLARLVGAVAVDGFGDTVLEDGVIEPAFH